MRENVYHCAAITPPIKKDKGGKAVDRLDVMKVFGAALDEGRLASASQRQPRHPILAEHVGTEPLRRPMRSIKLSEAKVRYAGGSWIRTRPSRFPRLSASRSGMPTMPPYQP
jgi:hypothetical protein